VAKKQQPAEKITPNNLRLYFNQRQLAEIETKLYLAKPESDLQTKKIE